MTRAPRPDSLRVWDLPVRLFHWSLLAGLVALYVTQALGRMELHARVGEAVLALVLFRLLWGLMGSQTARFRDFVGGGRTALAYLRQGRSPSAGHNPLGGWMIVALLGALLVQAGLGLFANDDILFEGPLAHLVSGDTSSLLTHWHGLLFKILAGLAALHVAAVLAHWFGKGENLILPMLTGRKPWPAERPRPVLAFVSPLRALAALAVAVAAVAALLRL